MNYYVKQKPTANLRKSNGDLLTELLWGDLVHPLEDVEQAGQLVEVRARGRRGFVKKSALRKETSGFTGLLEIYIIDVGQGDGVLVRTPDGKWHLIDAGVPNARQMTKKGAANFVRWKFYNDLRRNKVELESLSASHPDYDHYGGMLDLLRGELYDGRTFDVEVNNFYHCGMARFDAGNELGVMENGMVTPFPEGSHGIPRSGEFTTELLDDKNSFANPPRTLKASFGELAVLVDSKCNSAKRLSLADGHVPGYGPGDGDAVIHVLGPVLEEFKQNQFGLRKLIPKTNPQWWESKTRNGHSLVYRIDYKDARILLTGDLNNVSQNLLLSYVDKDEFAVDVTKGCHHGAEDVEVEFIKAIKARATVISSGDNESYAHPRPVLLGASAHYGRESFSTDGKVQAPLLHSTELARSATLDLPTSVKLDPDFSGPRPERWYSAKTTKIKTQSTNYRLLKNVPICTDLIYGLVNVRTDGKTILCATMLETGNSFDTKMFKAGLDVV